MSLVDRCEGCSRCVGQGAHLCGGCADALDRDASAPFWGDFAGHPDSKLLPIRIVDVEFGRAPDNGNPRIAA